MKRYNNLKIGDKTPPKRLKDAFSQTKWRISHIKWILSSGNIHKETGASNSANILVSFYHNTIKAVTHDCCSYIHLRAHVIVNVGTNGGPVGWVSSCEMCIQTVGTYTRSVNKVMRLIQYNSVLTFKLQIEFVPFKIVPLGGYTPLETLFPIFVATLVVANRNRF